MITELQRQLLPSALPVLPGVRIAGRYLLADSTVDAGSDWFDAVPIGDGRVAFVVGDVVGHGAAAVAAMGRLRAVLLDRLEETGDIATAIKAADRTARRVAGAHAATVCVVVLDPVDGTMRSGSAGHPPPLVAGAGEARYLPVAGAGPLGTGTGCVLAEDRLEFGESVLLYSDGILRRLGRDPDAASAELIRAAGGGRAIDQVCARVVEQLAGQTGHADDAVLLAAARRVPAAPLRLRLAADLGALQPVREALHGWLDSLGAGSHDVDALAHAVAELVTNAAEHSHPDSVDGTVTVAARLEADGTARITVADDGRWIERTRPGDDGFRQDHGLGLALAHRFVDRLDLEHGDGGTTATIRHRLSQPVRLLAAEEADETARSAEAAAAPLVLVQPHAPGNRVAVHGPLDAVTVEEFAAELDRLTLGGTHKLVLDLTAVTFLGSAAVSVLHRAAAADSPPFLLYAPENSLAHRVLRLAALPHTTTDPHP
ncbi:SpoIIE family protein phosphatase [Amycolatopsis sp. NPDC004079]|uniref:SpoIIE family protein phosphatase n=1 Tax=Amycolatopsis sp. NPDC004079 TaxID=3154549 RepID=UPI0033B2CF5B